jgi:hypothetical protein
MRARWMAVAGLLAAVGWTAGARAGTRDAGALIEALEAQLAESPPDAATDAAIRDHLEEALRLAKSGGTRSRADGHCVDYASGVYEKVYQPQDALEKATALCRGGLDGELLEMGTDVYAKVFQRTDAMEKVAKVIGRPELSGKGDIVAFAYGAYANVFQPVDAFEKAAAFTAREPRGSLGCIQRAWQTYGKTRQPIDALEAAGSLCSK